MTKLVALLLALCYARGASSLACYIFYSKDLKSYQAEDTTMVAAFELPPSKSGGWGVALIGSYCSMLERLRPLFVAPHATRQMTKSGVGLELGVLGWGWGLCIVTVAYVPACSNLF
jgi:hypothetical protein